MQKQPEEEKRLERVQYSKTQFEDVSPILSA